MKKNMRKIECFVALFDILGFKNILMDTKKLDVVAKAYKKMREDMANCIDHINRVLDRQKSIKTKVSVSIRNYSDNFLLYTSEVSDTGFDALIAACDFMFIVADSYQLPIRGATAVGELIVSDGIEIGKPIVDAYENGRKQDWIGCWITNECIKKVAKNIFNEHLRQQLIVKYKIPLKDGKVKKLYAFNWIKSRFVRDKMHFHVENIGF